MERCNYQDTLSLMWTEVKFTGYGDSVAKQILWLNQKLCEVEIHLSTNKIDGGSMFSN